MRLQCSMSLSFLFTKYQQTRNSFFSNSLLSISTCINTAVPSIEIKESDIFIFTYFTIYNDGNVLKRLLKTYRFSFKDGQTTGMALRSKLLLY